MSLRTVLFIDEVCPKPYSLGQFDGCGGTEQTVVRVAEGLFSTGLFEPRVEQGNRTTGRLGNGVAYQSLGDTAKADYVVCLRDPASMIRARARFPFAKIYLWSHDYNAGKLDTYLEAKCNGNLVVSEYHKVQQLTSLKSYGFDGQFPVRVMYNPLPDDLLPDATPYNKNKLIWTSSPHKGLDYALKIFANLTNFNPEFKLFVANPGYFPSPEQSQHNVIALGSIPHEEVIKNLRDSLCLFNPNIVFPETFGLVLAESDAVGTPVLTHAFGAAHEVTWHPHEVMDCRDQRRVIERVMTWHSGERPRVKMHEKFRLKEVIKSWIRFLS